jgi:hypothetical protein
VEATNGCSSPEELFVTQDPPAGTMVGLGVHTITVTVFDQAENSATCTTTFTVTDDAAAEVSCPAGTSVSADQNCQAPIPDVTEGVGATNGCSSAEELVLTQDPPAGTLVGLGTHTITVTVADQAGNTATCTTTFTVEDNTPPAIASCPEGFIAALDANCQIPQIPRELVIVTDNCTGEEDLLVISDIGDVVVVVDNENRIITVDFHGETFTTDASTLPIALAVIDVTVSVMDELGNVATCLVPVTIELGECPPPPPQPVPPPACDPNEPGLSLLMSALMRAPVCGLGCPLMASMSILGMVMMRFSYRRPRRKTQSRGR